MSYLRSGISLLVLCPLLTVACAVTMPEEERESTNEIRTDQLKDLKTVHVEGAGQLDVDGQYLPQVVCCENGGAPDEALKAQAVMARSYLAYKVSAENVGTAA